MQIARKLSPSCKDQPAKPKVSSESRTRLERPEESSRRVLRASECRVISEHSPTQKSTRRSTKNRLPRHPEAPKIDPKSLPERPWDASGRPGASGRRLGSASGVSPARPGSARRVPKGAPGPLEGRPGGLRSAPMRPKSTPSRARDRKN